MDSGSKVFRAYASGYDDRFTHWIDEGVVSEVVVDGQSLVRLNGVLTPLDDKWRVTRSEAQRDVHVALLRHIGKLQAKADEMADEILHSTLTAQEAVS
jgi:hypothetical protein